MMGQSGGRSAKNRTGEGAVARATQRERDHVDPPGRQEYARGWEGVRLTEKGERWVRNLEWVVVYLSLALMLALMTIVILLWWMPR